MKKVALVRGKFLNAYEMQIFQPLVRKYDITAFGSLTPYHDSFAFPVVHLPSPMDLPDFPKRMPILNRLFTDAHYLYGLEDRLRGFDIVHTAETYYRYTQQVINAKKKGYVKKVVATVLENIPFNNEDIWGRRQYKKRAREGLDHIIALTERTKAALLLEGADPQKITVIGHGIDTQEFMPRKNWLVGEKTKKKFTILFSGRLEYYKGVFDMLYAAKLLLMEKSLKDLSLSFVFVGNGGEKNAMIALEKKLGISTFIQHKNVSYEKMPMLYRQADIFWAPGKPTLTYQEQYCTALLEAQASGLPIVTTWTGGVSENVGDAAVLVGSGDVYGLKEAVQRFLVNPLDRITFAKKARKRALILHDSRLIAKRIDAVYELMI